MKSLKVNQIEKARLSKTEMDHLYGGASCGCACRYAGSGGSSSADNHNANDAHGLHSPDMIHFTARMNNDGTWTLCDEWITVIK